MLTREEMHEADAAWREHRRVAREAMALVRQLRGTPHEASVVPLREAAARMEGGTGTTCWARLARALDVDVEPMGRDWEAVSATCLEAIADRVDAQGVVTVTAPVPTPAQEPTQAPLQVQAYNLVRLVVEAYELGRAAR